MGETPMGSAVSEGVTFLTDAAHFYPVELVWAGRSVFLLWRTNGTDAYVGTPTDLLLWPNITRLRGHCLEHGLSLEESNSAPLQIDLDTLKRFVDSETELKPDVLLDLWNFFIDIESTHRSLAFSEMDGRLREVYGRVFSMTSAGDLAGAPPSPPTAEDVEQIRRILQLGLSMVRPLIEGARK